VIGKLLRELLPALGRFLRYRAGKLLHRRDSAAVRGPIMASMATQASIDVLVDDIGLDEKYERPIFWPFRRTDAPPANLRDDELYQLWCTIPGGHKWTHYFSVYSSIFGARRDAPLRVLEIGVLGGASLKLWRKYFRHPETVVVGIDISADCAVYESPTDAIYVRIGSQIDAVFLKNLVEEFGPFDVIVDDGSHISSHIITTFNTLYCTGLRDEGIYLVEDLHASYWHPWRDSRKSFFDVCKELLEHMQAHYRNAPPAAFLIEKASAQPSVAVEVPIITTMIKEIRFFDSMVAIYKTRRDHVPHYLYSP
jgi:hypothetical protein